MIFTVLGPQGSGKTTQAVLLAKRLNIPIVDSGGLIRRACEVETPQNKEACEQMKAGHLVPGEFAGGLLKTEVMKPPYTNGYILDGYPRKLEDLSVFDPKPDKVIYLDTPIEVCIERLLARKRFDDTEDGIKNRLKNYFEKTSEVLEKYREEGILIEVSAAGDVDSVFTELLRSIKEFESH